MKQEEENGTGNHQGSFSESEMVQMITRFFRAVLNNRIIINTFRTIAKILFVIFIVIFFFSFFFYIVPFVQDNGSKHYKTKTVFKNISSSKSEYRRVVNSIKNEVNKLSMRYRLLTPGQSYLVINTVDNRFTLFRNRKLIREGFCSSGSYIRLVTPEGSREWIFRTPKGIFRIQQKVVKPMWIKPDWAFIEEGLPVPPPNHESRYERGVLGDYALSLGDGYLIHGTLYQRFIGMPVTHGCIRLGDQDLEEVFKTLNVGSKVFIF